MYYERRPQVMIRSPLVPITSVHGFELQKWEKNRARYINGYGWIRFYTSLRFVNAFLFGLIHLSRILTENAYILLCVLAHARTHTHIECLGVPYSLGAYRNLLCVVCSLQKDSLVGRLLVQIQKKDRQEFAGVPRLKFRYFDKLQCTYQYKVYLSTCIYSNNHLRVNTKMFSFFNPADPRGIT